MKEFDVDDPTSLEKTCTRCGETKPLEMFSKLAASRDGRHPRCKACRSLDGKQHYSKNRDRILNRQASKRQVKRKPPEPMPDRKVCTVCGEMKPMSEYGRHPNGRWGYYAQCAECCRKQARARSNPERTRELYQANREARLKYSREYYRANLDKSRAWQQANRERIREVARAWREANSEAYREYHAEWRRKNRARRSGYDARRKTAKRETWDGIPINDADLWDACGGVCYLCNRPIDRSIPWPEPMSPSLDHVVPLIAGGRHSQDNLKWTHLTCNLQKGVKNLGA